MSWTIVSGGAGYVIKNEAGVTLGTIVPNYKRKTYAVEFHDAPALNWDGGNNESNTAVGYVRGIERAVNVYGKEIGKP